MGILRILAMRQKLADNRQAIADRQPPSRAGELTADLDVAFASGQFSKAIRLLDSHAALIAEQAHRPEADIGVGVSERLKGNRLGEAAAQVQSPQGLQGRLALATVNHS